MLLVFSKFKLIANRSKLTANQGFTLVEMMVVIVIFTITTGIVLANLPAFRDKASLDLVAQEVATVIRQAQVYGAAVRGFSNQGYTSYGIHLPLETGGQLDGTADTFYLFSDPDDGGQGQMGSGSKPDCTAQNFCLESYDFRGGISVRKVVGCDESGCANVGQPFNIVFQRPMTDAKFYRQSGDPNGESYSYVKIILASPKNQCREVKVWSTGHIYVEPDIATYSCP